ncbi:MAG: hypothetical protein ABJE10_06440, partial [bacterium]
MKLLAVDAKLTSAHTSSRGTRLEVCGVYRRFGWLLAFVIIESGTACRTAPTSEVTRLDRAAITREQMLAGDYSTVYDAVAALRSNWLRPRGPDSLVQPSIVWVYVDGVRAGSIDVLRGIQPRLVNTARFYDGPTATGRWGVDNGAGVIHISTWNGGDPGIHLPDSTRRAPK